jgi:hypothetical protein
MADHSDSDLIQRAETLRRQAESERDENIRHRLNRMANYYIHLADSRSRAEKHVPSAAALGELFTKTR